LSKNDVWRELMESLNQKAKTPEETLHILAEEKLQKFYKNYDRKEWVRLEDVLSILQQLKQNYFFVPKDKFAEFLSQWCRAFRIEVKPEDIDLEKIQKELLRKNEG